MGLSIPLRGMIVFGMVPLALRLHVCAYMCSNRLGDESGVCVCVCGVVVMVVVVMVVVVMVCERV